MTDSLRVTGANLAAISAVLASEGGAQINLEVCDSQDSAADLILPASLPAGAYTLTLTNAAGSCGQGLTLLQGEPGERGVPGSLDASGAQIIASLNEALAEDASLELRGAWPGHLRGLSVVANAIDPSATELYVDGASVVSGSTAGFYVSTFDGLAESSATGHVFLTTTANSASTLAILLEELELGEVVMIATAGDVTSMTSSNALANAVQGLGATQFTGFTSSTAYALIGQRGAGYPLERKLATSNGYARLATALVDGAFLSNPTPNELPVATASRAGVLSAADFSSFNNRLTNVVAGNGVEVSATGTTRTIDVVYGTTAGTAAEGDDTRLSNARAPTSGSGHYIQAQTATAQATGFRINGTGRVGALVSDGGATVNGNLSVSGNVQGAYNLSPAVTVLCQSSSTANALCAINDKHFCALAEVKSNGVSAGTYWYCSLTYDGDNNWTLTARSSSSSHTTDCKAICF